MIRYKSNRQIPLEGFHLPFGGQLNPENRWIKWCRVIPWDELAVGYYKAMDNDRGRPCKDARLIIGAVIVKHKLTLSDEETVLQIQENPYLQYFVGFSGYKDEQPFAPSLFVEIRKRMGVEMFSSFEGVILEKIGLAKGTTGAGSASHRGKLLLDATVAEQSVRYPTDISLLNEARQISEGLIDELYQLSDLSRKPRTYRRKARRQYLLITKKRRVSIKERRHGIREQLQYLRRNLKHIATLLDDIGSTPFPLRAGRQRQYWIIQHVYSQQDGMYQDKRRRCDDRIVSISQPHVRPIVRGKVSKPTEFGAKLSVSMIEGIALVDRISWSAFNESQDLKGQIESYKRRSGYYPESVLADGIYGNRENRRYMKERGIRFGGKALGRPPKQTEENRDQLKQEQRQRRLDALERIPIEGKFGQGKNGYRLNYIRARLQKTSESWINSIFLVMNLMVLLRELYEDLLVLAPNCCFLLFQTISTRIDLLLGNIFMIPQKELVPR